MSALAVVTKPAGPSTDDLDLVAAVRSGDDRAFELLFLRYQGRINAYVRGMVRDHARAEDITQEVFIAALRRLRETDTRVVFKPWIYEIAKNACIDQFRRSRHTSEVSFDADDGLGPTMVASGGGPDAVVDAKLAIDNLCGAFGGLSQAHHDILVMREFEGLTYQEIGERLGMSRAAVESTLFRARRRLGEEYDELASGARCVRVQGIIDAPRGRAVGLRDKRRMARHVAHCQPCRRYARLAGADLGGARMPSAPARIAALLPLPTSVRRRIDLDNAGQLLGQHSAPALHWSTKVVGVVDPATVAGWPKVIATAATVAVAGLGAGAAVGQRDALKSFVAKEAGIDRHVASVGSSSGDMPRVRAPRRAAGDAPAAPAAATGTARGEDQPAMAGDQQAVTSPAAEQAPATGPSEAGSKPSATAPITDAVKDVGAAVPDAPVASADDLDAGDVPRGPSPRPVAGLLQDTAGAVGGGQDAGVSAPGTLTDVVSTAQDTIMQGAGTGDVAAGTTVSAGTQQTGPITTVVGQLLGGAGSGSR